MKLLAPVGAAVFVVACLLVPQGLLHDSYYSDVHVYGDYARHMLAGQVPYRDFSDEYPPAAQLVFLAARSALAFKLLMTACGLGCVRLAGRGAIRIAARRYHHSIADCRLQIAD